MERKQNILRYFPSQRQAGAPAAGPRSSKSRLVLILALDPDSLLDVALLVASFAAVNRANAAEPAYDVRVISSKLDVQRTNRFLQPEASWSEYTDLADTVLIAGDDSGRSDDRESLLSWLRWQALHSRRIGAISGGALLFAAAGLLNGKRATAHWQYQEVLSARYPRVLLDREAIFVRDANLYTCAGSTAAVDLALCMIEEDLGAHAATGVARRMLLPFRRSGSAPQISDTLRAQGGSSGAISRLLGWLPCHLQENLSVPALARHCAMSSRNFARNFRCQVGITPGKHVENLRLQAAQSHLELGNFTVDEVASAAGFDNGETLRRVFRRRLGMTPGRYRSARLQPEP